MSALNREKVVLHALVCLIAPAILESAAACTESSADAELNATGNTGASGGVAQEDCPTERYEIVDPGNPSTSYSIDCPTAGSGCDGSGLVKDLATGLEWLRFEYFPGRAMRLPTTDESLGIAGDNYLHCVWQPYWATWTTIAVGATHSTVVRNDGSTLELDIQIDGAPALCVR